MSSEQDAEKTTHFGFSEVAVEKKAERVADVFQICFNGYF